MTKLDFAGAIERPFEDFRKLSIGALTFLIPFLNIITGMMGTGYALKLARKPGKLPEWEDWGELFKQGLFAYIIMIIYLIPLLIIGSIVAIGAGVGGMVGMSGMDAPMGFLALLGPVAAVLAIIGLAFYYFIPAAVINYAKSKDIRSAFDFGDLMSRVSTGEYFQAWIFNLFYGLVIGAAIGFLNLITAVTVVLPAIISAYGIMILMLTSMDIYGQVWN